MTCKLPEGRTHRVIFHAVCSSEINSSCSAGYWSDHRADIGTLFFPDKIQTEHSQTHIHKEESLSFVKGMMVEPLSTAGVSDEVAQKLQMPMGQRMLEDVDEPMLARPTTLRDPGIPIKSGWNSTV